MGKTKKSCKRAVRLVALILLALIPFLIASCDIALSESPRWREERILGTWESGIDYYASDALYDYAAKYTLSLTPSGNAEISSSYFIKLRTEDSWHKNLSRPDSFREYDAFDSYASIRGWDGEIELRTKRDWILVREMLYRLENDGKTLVLGERAHGGMAASEYRFSRHAE